MLVKGWRWSQFVPAPAVTTLYWGQGRGLASDQMAKYSPWSGLSLLGMFVDIFFEAGLHKGMEKQKWWYGWAKAPESLGSPAALSSLPVAGEKQ